MSGLDGAFLSLESPTTHLHILGAMIFDPSGVEGGLSFGRIRDLVADRLTLVPPFRQRMVNQPFGLQHPRLADDPDFDLDFHLRKACLPEPGGRRELAELIAGLASRPLDRSRPLWEFHVVEGLEHGHIAIVPKVHHSIIDGVSGAEVMAAFFDLSPESNPVPHPLFKPEDGQGPVSRPSPGDGESKPLRRDGGHGTAGQWSPEPLPGETEGWRNVLGSFPGQADALVRSISRSLQSARSTRDRARHSESSSSPALFEAPRTSINRAISSHRRIAFAELALSDVEYVKQVLGGTTNDVVLAATSGGMRAFFAARNEPLESALVAMVPVSVRAGSERDTLGNRLSALFVSLANGVEDPAMRYRRIRDAARAAKAQSEAVGREVFAGWAEAIVPAVATRLSRLVTTFRLFDHLAPLFNVIVSNVPGPGIALYLSGAKLVAMYPIGPIIEGVGVNVTVFSYLDTIYVGIQADWDLVPDIEVIAASLPASLAELVEAAGRKVRTIPWWHAELPA
jgi:diacylglycerol O-acyltransferase